MSSAATKLKVTWYVLYLALGTTCIIQKFYEYAYARRVAGVPAACVFTTAAAVVVRTWSIISYHIVRLLQGPPSGLIVV